MKLTKPTYTHYLTNKHNTNHNPKK
jgi:hypothetical protein